MKEKIKVLQHIMMTVCVAFTLLVMLGVTKENVQAAPSFKMDEYVIAVGDEVYLPYLVTSPSGARFGSWDLPYEWPVDMYPFSEGGYSDTVCGIRTGTANINYYKGESLDISDTLKVRVTSRPAFALSGTTAVGMQAGQICRSFYIKPGETNIYNFFVDGTSYSEIRIYEQDYDDLVGYAKGTGNHTELSVELNRFRSYYMELYTYDSASDKMTAPNIPITLNVTVTANEPASSVDMHVNAYPLKVENDTYYMMSGDFLELKIVQGGVPNFKKVDYRIASTNSDVVWEYGTVSEDVYKMFCMVPGTAEVSVTTTNMLTDTITIVVLSPDQIIAGDVNLDGALTKEDMVNLYYAANGLIDHTRIYYHADVNGNGAVDEEDVKILWKHIDGLPYVDIEAADWFYDAVEYNYNENIMTGMNCIQFGPYESLSRAQFALILYRMQQMPEVTVKNPFEDLNGDEWYAKAVLWAYDNGIVTGFEDGTFRPADLITREQMMAMMYRYADYLGKNVDEKAEFDEFLDSDSVSGYAVEAMKWAVGNGILTGKATETGSLLDPWGATARAEAAVIIQRFAN